MTGVTGYPFVRLKALTDAGIFKTAIASGSLTFPRGKFPPFTITVDWNASRSQVTLSYMNGASRVSETIGISESNTAFGIRRYFVCPITHKRCTTLYLADGRFGSRQGFGLTYSNRQSSSRADRLLDRIHVILDRLQGLDGRGPARGANRKKLLARLLVLDTESLIRRGVSPVDWFPEFREATDPVDQERDALKQRHRRTLRENGLDTASGYERALQTYPPNVEATLRTAAQGLVSIPMPALPRAVHGVAKTSDEVERLPPTIAILEDHARLDVRVLVSKGLFEQGTQVGFLLDWGETSAEIDGVHGFVDLRDMNQPCLAMEYLCQGEVSYQKICLMRSGTKRPSWKAVCPVTGEEVYLLAFRMGQFASRKAQRLVNRSQRAMQKT